MDEPYNPDSQLRALLGPRPSHPWGALIPQVLLWCFRRFCLKKLTETYDTPLTEQVWNDHLELIHEHAPAGLEYASSSWLTPENIEHVHSSLEEYNRFFMDFLVETENCIYSSDSDTENSISAFLDTSMKLIIREWLGEEYYEYLIFPMRDEEEDEFTDEQFNRLIETLMKLSSEPEAAPPPPSELEAAPPPPSEPEAAAPPPSEPEAAAPPPSEPEAVAPPPPSEPEAAAPPRTTFREIIARYKTRRIRNPRLVRGKTRRFHAAL